MRGFGTILSGNEKSNNMGDLFLNICAILVIIMLYMLVKFYNKFIDKLEILYDKIMYHKIKREQGGMYDFYHDED